MLQRLEFFFVVLQAKTILPPPKITIMKATGTFFRFMAVLVIGTTMPSPSASRNTPSNEKTSDGSHDPNFTQNKERSMQSAYCALILHSSLLTPHSPSMGHPSAVQVMGRCMSRAVPLRFAL